jgi:peptidoglycan/LPS O-acetylase OafA/YrhL
VVLLPLFLVVMSQHWRPVWKATLFGILFCFLLVLTLPSDPFIKIRERNIFSRLGIYTYGIYLYHLFVILSCKKLFGHLSLSLDNAWYALLFSIICFGLTLLVSYLSYQYFEKPFLKLKRRFRAKHI